MEWATWMLVWAGILFYILYKFDDWREVKAETWILLVSIVVLYQILLKPIIQKNTQEAHDKLNKRAEDHRQHRL
jgi:hypothetical protein